jgi:hypothetical protein
MKSRDSQKFDGSYDEGQERSYLGDSKPGKTRPTYADFDALLSGMTPTFLIDVLPITTK